MVIRNIKLMRSSRCCITVVTFCVLFVTLYMLRNFKMIGTKVDVNNYENGFHYPMDVDLKPLVKEFLEERKHTVQPINLYLHDFPINSNLCSLLDEVDVIIAVRSALDNFERREAIRKTFGQQDLVRGKVIRTFFFVGIRGSDDMTSRSSFDQETEIRNDIIQASFIDHYFFNTIKTMTIFRWMYEYCPHAKYCLITDDYMYISPANLLRYLSSWEEKVNKTGQQDRRLLAGNVSPKFQPQRVRGDKWYIPRTVYPWNDGPPFPEGGAYVMSWEAVYLIYAASLFVRHLLYEDVYIGIVAHKIGIKLTHCPQFRFNMKLYSQSEFKDVIACQGFETPKTFVTIWNELNKRVKS